MQIFDFDGTLSQTGEAYGEAFNLASFHKNFENKTFRPNNLRKYQYNIILLFPKVVWKESLILKVFAE